MTPNAGRPREANPGADQTLNVRRVVGDDSTPTTRQATGPVIRLIGCAEADAVEILEAIGPTYAAAVVAALVEVIA